MVGLLLVLLCVKVCVSEQPGKLLWQGEAVYPTLGQIVAVAHTRPRELQGQVFVLGWCDHTKTELRPGGGWHHQPHTLVDLCSHEFAKLPPHEQEGFVEVLAPGDLGGDLQRYDVVTNLNAVFEEAGVDIASLAQSIRDTNHNVLVSRKPPQGEEATECDGGSAERGGGTCQDTEQPVQSCNGFSEADVISKLAGLGGGTDSEGALHDTVRCASREGVCRIADALLATRPDVALPLLRHAAKAGHGRAQFVLGVGYLYGVYTLPADTARATLHFEFAAASGFVPAVLALATLRVQQGRCSEGAGMLKGIAFQVVGEWEARNGEASADAVGRMGQYVATHVGGRAGQDEVLQWGSAEGRAWVDDVAGVIGYWQGRANQGDAHALTVLGATLLRGRTKVEKDPTSAVAHLRQAAALGSARAMATLGTVYLRGIDGHVERNHTLAMGYYADAARKGDGKGLAGLGVMLLEGKGVPRDPGGGMAKLRRGVERGSVEAMVNIALAMVRGVVSDEEGESKLDLKDQAPAQGGSAQVGDPKTSFVQGGFKGALRYLRTASAAGHVLATYHLGIANLYGLGMAANCPDAAGLLNRVVATGSWLRVARDAWELYKGGGPTDVAVATALFVEAAAMGSEQSAFNAAYVLQHRAEWEPKDREREEEGEKVDMGWLGWANGLNSRQLDRLALTLFLQSMRHGYAPARIQIGDLFFEGRIGSSDSVRTLPGMVGPVPGFGQSVSLMPPGKHVAAGGMSEEASGMELALAWYLTAADAGLPQGMYNAGYMHQHGMGAAQDFHLAKRFYDQAGAHKRGSRAVWVLAVSWLFAHWFWHDVSAWGNANPRHPTNDAGLVSWIFGSYDDEPRGGEEREGGGSLEQPRDTQNRWVEDMWQWVSVIWPVWVLYLCGIAAFALLAWAER